MSINLIPEQRTYSPRRGPSAMVVAVAISLAAVGATGATIVVDRQQVATARAATARVKQDLAVRTEDMQRAEDELAAARNDTAAARSDASSARTALSEARESLAATQRDLAAAHANQKQLLRCASAALGAATDAIKGDYYTGGAVEAACQPAIDGARDTLGSDGSPAGTSA